MQNTPLSVKYILSVYFTGLIFFTAFRCLLILTNLHQLHDVVPLWSTMLYSLVMGFRFDTAVSGYLMALPAVVLLIAELGGVMRRRLFLSMHMLLCLLYSICFFICAADIPFYSNYGNRLNVSILNWTGTPMFAVKMIWQDNILLGYFLLFVLATALFALIMARLYRQYLMKMMTITRPANAGKFIARLSVSILLLGLIFLGIRGRTDEKSPIVVGTAYFCNYALPNQAGLNPVFTFMWSWTDGWKDENKKLQLISDDEAIKNVQQSLDIHNRDNSITRQISGTTPLHNYNVVLVLMESMGAHYMKRFGNNANLTPCLDSLAANGFTFTNFYSAGIHTFNGIFSTLYSHPALMARHSMEGAIIPAYTGMPCFFKQRGYETMYFTTHDDQFDNVGGFLTSNYMNTIISKENYPVNESVSTLGVPDHKMFDHSLPLLLEQNKQHKPFFAVYMTATNHSPYVVPTDILFTPKHPAIRGGCVEYSDWAVGRFMKIAATMPWYDSTIFIFLGDHGTWDGQSYGNLAYSYSHIPCIIYARILRNKHEDIQMPGGQIDVFPTIAGLLGGSYVNNTPGIDLLSDSRKWMLFSQDDKIGVADKGQVYIWEKNGNESMYDFAEGKEILQNNRAKADSMKTYGLSMIQYAQWLRNNNKTGAPAARQPEMKTTEK